MTRQPPANAALEDVRREIDRIDDEIAALIEARFAAVERVRLAKAGSPVRSPFRPFREAAVIGRLVKNRGAHVPGELLVRLWRAIMSAATARQHRVSVHVPEAVLESTVLRDLIRDHFCPLPLAAAADAGEALARVAADGGDLAVVAAGSDWAAALQPGLAVIAALPLTAAGAPPLFIIAAAGAEEPGEALSLVIDPPGAAGQPSWRVQSGAHHVAAFTSLPSGLAAPARIAGRLPLPVRLEE